MPEHPAFSDEIEQRLVHTLRAQRMANSLFILAVSGGMDSMVLSHLFLRLQLRFVMAHCNFQLRGEESDGDEQLVARWAAGNQVPYYVRHFDTRHILDQEGGNLQDTARKLRYAWFEQLRQELQADLVATAHHANDSIETLLMNLFKGTGIKGLHGIRFRQGNIVRPLIGFDRKQLAAYAQANNIVWREDSSNKKIDYIRNAIRHELLPLAERIFPNAAENLKDNISRFAEAGMLYEQALERHRKKLVEQRGTDFHIPVLKLQHAQPIRTIVYELTKPFGFQAAQVEQILYLLDAETGRYVQSASHRIIRNRNFLIITALREQASSFLLIEEADIADNREVDTGDFTIRFRTGEFNGNLQFLRTGKETAFIDVKQLKFPLILRRWKTGDYFYPLGMKKKKKVARFLIDQKVPLHEKEAIWVIEDNHKRIIWLVGQRPDDRFRITSSTKQMLKISVLPHKDSR